MTIKMVNGKIGVMKLGKTSKDPSSASGSLFAVVEVADSLGVVTFVGDGSNFKEGMKVYYGSQREEIRMQGMDIQVMDEKNIYAIVGEETN